jgi:hypothetical protein
MSESELQISNDDPNKVGNQEPFHAPIDLESAPLGDGSGIRPPTRKSPRSFLLMLAAAVLAIGSVVILTQNNHPGKPKMAMDSDDLGAGIDNASGLRGHLVTRWQGKAQYMLKIEPLDPRYSDGFAAVAGNPTGPISINIRLLDSSGFALCGKEIVLRYDPTHANRIAAPAARNKAEAEKLAALRQVDLERVSAQEKDRERGKDAFQNIQDSGGTVEALWAQGELPCSPDQYKRFDYWDLSTNFPTLPEQDQILGRKHPTSANRDEQESARGDNSPARRKAPPKPQSAFYMEGDDRATAFEPGRNLLTIGPGKTFTVVRTVDVATAASWADDSSLIHYTCDQHATCALKQAGSASVVLAKMD